MGRHSSAPPHGMVLITCRLNVARLANIPESVLQIAAVKSKELEEQAQEKGLENVYVDTGGVGSVLISTDVGLATYNHLSRVREWTNWTRSSPLLSNYSLSRYPVDPERPIFIDGSFDLIW